jgi:hypothetical protein
MEHSTTGGNNTALGFGTLRENQTGIWNTAGGTSALWSNTTGNSNVAFGGEALAGNIDGNYNTAVGTRALWSHSNVTGTSFGHGHNNTALGFEALRDLGTGSNNIGMGFHALRVNSTGNRNIGIGNDALTYNTTGSDNITVGHQALYNNTGSNNIAIGSYALYENTWYGGNVAIGQQALYASTSGGHNVAIGYQALMNNVGEVYYYPGSGGVLVPGDGCNNTAVGHQALYLNTRGGNNTANGSYALYNNTTGYDNTVNGIWALYSNTTGRGNTANGSSALLSNTTGLYNTAIGYNADVSANNLNNATAIGYGARATASNSVRIGNINVNSIGGYTGWSTISDGRAKKNIRQDVPGLEFIKLLQPVTYNLDLDAIDALIKYEKPERNDSLPEQPVPQELLDIQKKAREVKEKQLQTGFVAQDVAETAKSLGYDFSGVDVDESGIYSLRYAEFVAPLVKAVQELSEQNETKDAAITALQDQVDELKELVTKLLEKENDPFPIMNAASNPEASLEQNFPNPFNQSTTIRYILPKTFRSAMIVITNYSGNVFKQLPVSGSGAGSVTIDAGSLLAGTYFYSLYVDNSLVDSKKMILTK